ncbi:MAG: hypothetical protein ACLFR2_08175 [Candidatus Kapaibacterium sp.]
MRSTGIFINIFLLLLIPYFSFAGLPVDTVISFTPGTGQSAGQADEYFPENIFGLPSRSSTENTPETSPGEICSIGLGGEIILSIRDNIIIDGPGPDFTIFENSFKNPINGKIYAEPAKIAVSPDGSEWYEFPFDSLTLEGCAGTKPTYGSADPYDPLVSGGNSFDLADIGVGEIKYIKITDISSIILDNPQHPYYDFTISGFDLDAVLAINTQQAVSVRDPGEIATINTKLDIYSLDGRAIAKAVDKSDLYNSLEALTKGIYILVDKNGRAEKWLAE